MQAHSQTAVSPQEEPSPYTQLTGGIFGIFFAGAVFSLATANPWLTAASILSLPLYMALLWRKGETPVLLFAVSFQWLQVSAKVFHANVLGVPVSDIGWWLGGGSPSIERAIWLGLIGLAVLAVGMRLGMRKLKPTDPARTAEETRAFSVDRAFLALPHRSGGNGGRSAVRLGIQFGDADTRRGSGGEVGLLFLAGLPRRPAQ